MMCWSVAVHCMSRVTVKENMCSIINGHKSVHTWAQGKHITADACISVMVQILSKTTKLCSIHTCTWKQVCGMHASPLALGINDRLLVNAARADPKLVMRSLAMGLKANTGALFVLHQGALCVPDALNLSSVHLTFNLKEERNLLEEEGFISIPIYDSILFSLVFPSGRTGVQYHWENNAYGTFDDFLMDLKQSKRKNIRQANTDMDTRLLMDDLAGKKECCQEWGLH